MLWKSQLTDFRIKAYCFLTFLLLLMLLLFLFFLIFYYFMYCFKL
uniref:Uncharacterized protein n=1 Tax=Anguilla anguilla TaxID=7936 RepID=A0A0E9W3E6_ANGAN